MILLLGGTSETAGIADALLKAHYRVLASMATQVDLELPIHDAIEYRRGPLDVPAMLALLEARRVHALVDATHPYATQAHAMASMAAQLAGVPYLRWIRPATPEEGLAGVIQAPSHEEAARLACALGRTVFLTIGTRHLAPYAQEATRAGIRLVARVLLVAESLDACREAGLRADDILAARGPFSVEATRRALRECRAGVLVTKESGAAGGVPEKLAAARAEGCKVVLVCRPSELSNNTVSTLDELLVHVRR